MASRLVRVGGWLFEHRALISVPLALALLLVPAGRERSPLLVIPGIGLVAAGEALRLWGVHHIGVISRTRSDRLGPLVASGPFAIVRNPLYLGNIALWAGFAFSAGLPWLVPVFVLVLGMEYHAIVRWEEQLLAARLGDRYRAYAAQIPRWLPRVPPAVAPRPATSHSWRETLFSERGTLIAIAVGYALLWVKARAGWI